MNTVEAPNEISSVWRTLENRTASARPELEVYETRVSLPQGSALLAMDSHNNRHVLIPVPHQSKVSPDRRSGGVHLLTRTFSDGAEDRRFVDLVCVKPHLQDVFATFTGELLADLAIGDYDRIEVRISKILEDWRDLFARESGQKLGRTALAGLFGELWNLRELCRKSTGGIEAWKGPEGGRHDFRAAGSALEIKTTLRSHGRIVEIHGSRQLLPPPDSDLFVCFLRLEEAEMGKSVPELVEDIQRMGIDRREFTRKLNETGYSASDEESYREYQFHIQEKIFYLVDESFPRIVPASFADGEVPPGILSLSYTVDLSGPEPSPIDGSDVDSLYESLIGNHE